MDPMAVVRNYIAAFNRGDAKSMAESFTDSGVFLMAWRLACGGDQQSAKIGIEPCSQRYRGTEPQITSSP